MTTTTVHTIGAAGDYTTLQAWEDAAPANLVTSDVVWRGEMLESFSYGSSGVLLTISGSTSDATRYKVLAPQAGLSFKDHASKLTNPQRADASVGLAITGSGHSYGNPIIACTELYARIENLQIIDTAGSNGGAISGLGCVDCIVEGNSVGSNMALIRSAQSMTNTLVILRSSTSSSGGILNVTGQSPAFVNCSIVVPSDLTAAQYCVVCSYSVASSFKNCAVFGAASFGTGLGSTTVTNCYTDASSPPSGCTQIAYDTSTGSGFEATLNATRDFRIKSTSTLKDNGTATGAPAADIVGTTRATVDVGVWEYAASGGGSVKRGLMLGIG